ncbi:hypothetical protein BDP27DRAFT_1503182, partial [Rhodocollybia butyracea]
MLKDVLAPSARPEPVIELASESGLKLIFETNRTGTMFYSNAWSDPAKGARKRFMLGRVSRTMEMGISPETPAAFLGFHDVLG